MIERKDKSVIDAMPNEVQKEIKILKKGSSGTLLPIQCDFCNSEITTTHVCCHPDGNRRIEGDEKNICGLGFCVMCNTEEDNRTKCKNHIITCLPCNEKNEGKNHNVQCLPIYKDNMYKDRYL